MKNEWIELIGVKNKHFNLQSFTVHLTGKYKGREFDDREVTFVLGETAEEEVILGIQEALIYFGKGEISRLVKHFPNKFISSRSLLKYLTKSIYSN